MVVHKKKKLGLNVTMLCKTKLEGKGWAMAGGTPSHTSEKVVGSIPSQGTYRFQVRSPFGAHAEGSFLSHQSLSLSLSKSIPLRSKRKEKGWEGTG